MHITILIIKKGNMFMQRREINRKIRETLGMSGRELSERVEVTKQTISNYECGKNTYRPLERVIEWELDLAIDNCTDLKIKKLCEQLKSSRV